MADKAWSSPADLRSQVRRLWDQGRWLAALLESPPPFPMRLALRTPDSEDCSRRFEEVRAWSHALQSAAPGHWRLEVREWRHPVLGRNSLPHQAWIDDIDQPLRILGRQADARRFMALIDHTRAVYPVLLPWLRDKPMKALGFADAWPRLLQVVAWIEEHPRSAIYLRQVDLPGIDSKFIEQHRAVLSELLDRVLPETAIDTGSSGSTGFARRYGFLEKPVRIRFRSLDARYSPLSTGAREDISVDSHTLARLDPPVSRVFITENEINFLAFPPLAASLVIFGSGYGLHVLGHVPWLQAKRVFYWGDLDTHGFAILDELREWLPHARSLLMDMDTLLRHQTQWSAEASPTQRDLPRLDTQERQVYDALRWRRLAPHAVRLEQERIGFGSLVSALQAISRE